MGNKKKLKLNKRSNLKRLREQTSDLRARKKIKLRLANKLLVDPADAQTPVSSGQDVESPIYTNLEIVPPFSIPESDERAREILTVNPPDGYTLCKTKYQHAENSTAHTSPFPYEIPVDKVDTHMENYIKYRMVGGQLKLRKGATPHKIDSQIAIKQTENDILTPREIQMQKRIDQLSQSLLDIKKEIKNLKSRNRELDKKVLDINKKLDALTNELGKTKPKDHERSKRRSSAKKLTKIPSTVKQQQELVANNEHYEKHCSSAVHTVIVKEEDKDITIEEVVIG